MTTPNSAPVRYRSLGAPAAGSASPRTAIPAALAARPRAMAVIGALTIAFSAILVRAAEVAPEAAAVLRCAYAVPVLWWLAHREDRALGPRPPRDRRLAAIAGVFFAIDLVAWHHAIDDVGAGLATVLANVQVVLVPLAAWMVLGERPGRRILATLPVLATGVVLISGALEQGGYGENPPRGVAFGITAGIAYAGFILALRAGSQDPRRPAGPLSDATAVSAALSLAAALAMDTSGLMPSWPEHAWLLLLALSSQVIGWILISASLPRLPAALTSVLLTIQPLGSMLLGIAIFAEAPSALQLAGVAAILAGLVLVGRVRPTPDKRVGRLGSRNGPCALGGWEGASSSTCLETRSLPPRALRFLARYWVRATRPVAERLRAGARRYGTVLAVPGVRVPLALSALGSLPIGIYVLGILLLAREATGSFAEAGRVAGAFGLANALGAVAQGRAMDRLGQPRVLRAVATVHATAVAALLFATRSDAPPGILIACAVASGGSLPQLPAAMRALWPTLISGESDRQTAYASGAIAFGVAVVTAPALVAGLVAIGSPGLAVGVAAGIAGTAALAFSATAASRRWQGGMHATGWLGPLTAPGVRTIFGAMIVLGVVLGVVQVAVPAVTAEAGSTALAGVLLAVMSAGSLVGGIAYGARSWPGGFVGKLAALFTALALGCALLTVVAPLPIMAVILFGVGLLLAPITIVSSSLLDIAAPGRAITEAFSIIIMGDVAGTAAGTAIAGTLIDATSVTTAVAAAAATAVCGAAFVIGRHRTLTTHGSPSAHGAFARGVP